MTFSELAQRSVRQTPQRVTSRHALNIPVSNSGDRTLEILMEIFRPFVSNSLKPATVINVCPVDVFKERFKITSDILDPIDEAHSKGYEFILAGGKLIDFCNNLSKTESVNDYDLWVLHEEELGRPAPPGWDIIDVKSHVNEYRYGSHKIQLVKAIYSCTEEVIQKFDFRTCAIAYDGRKIFWAKKTLHDIRDKVLTMQSLESKRSTSHRVMKYIQRGYSINGPDFALASISHLGSLRNEAPPMYLKYLLRDATYEEVAAAEQDSEQYQDMVENNQIVQGRRARIATAGPFTGFPNTFAQPAPHVGMFFDEF